MNAKEAETKWFVGSRWDGIKKQLVEYAACKESCELIGDHKRKVVVGDSLAYMLVDLVPRWGYATSVRVGTQVLDESGTLGTAGHLDTP